VYKQQGGLSQAAEALRKAIQLQPDFAGAHTTLAAVLRQQGDAQGSAAESKLGAEISQQKMTLQAAEFTTNSGIKLLNAGDLDGAIQQFEAAVKADASYASAHQQLALALERKGDKVRANHELETAKQLQSLQAR
jgi:Tfp pilus assembly protein PilF